MCRKISQQGRPALAWLNRELWLELREKKENLSSLEEGAGSSGGLYKDVMRLRREKIRRAKAPLELHLATAVKDNKKCFHKYIGNTGRLKRISNLYWRHGGT